MSAGYRVLKKAGRHIDEIYIYTRDTWGEKQARVYIDGLFVEFKRIVNRETPNLKYWGISLAMKNI